MRGRHWGWLGIAFLVLALLRFVSSMHWLEDLKGEVAPKHHVRNSQE